MHVRIFLSLIFQNKKREKAKMTNTKLKVYNNNSYIFLKQHSFSTSVYNFFYNIEKCKK